MAGIEASTMTSLGTCRLVMPRSESTIASAGPSARPCCDAGLDRRRAASAGSSSSDSSRLPEAVVGADAGVLEGGAVLGEDVGEERLAPRGRR